MCVLHLTRRGQLTSSLLRSGAKALQPVEDEQEEVLPSKAEEEDRESLCLLTEIIRLKIVRVCVFPSFF